jgi:erythronate-4-phosphate dehydrogenase
MTRDPSKLRWVVDDAIPLTPLLHRIIGEVVCLPGRDISAAVVRDADVLLVRSITPVDERLVAGSRLRFIGTATAGHDHIDAEAMDRLGITWCYAPGCNAVSVVEYVLSAIALAGQLKCILAGAPVGIIGLGEVGTRLGQKLARLGCDVVGYDPLRAHWPECVRRAALDEVLCQPVVTLHAALHDEAEHPSHGLIDATKAELMCLAAKRRGERGLFINAGRGDLMTQEALDILLSSSMSIVLDTWPGEPLLGEAVLRQAGWVSPHIAGHSVTAKKRGADMLAQSVARWSGIEIMALIDDVDDRAARSLDMRLMRDVAIADAAEWLEAFLIGQSTLQREDVRLRRSANPDLSAGKFDDLRRTYQQPTEWTGQTFRMSDQSGSVSAMTERLGITVVKE